MEAPALSEMHVDTNLEIENKFVGNNIFEKPEIISIHCTTSYELLYTITAKLTTKS